MNELDKVLEKRREIIRTLNLDRFYAILGHIGVGTCAGTWNLIHEHADKVVLDGWVIAYIILALSSLTTLACEIENLDDDKEWLKSFDSIHGPYEKTLK